MCERVRGPWRFILLLTFALLAAPRAARAADIWSAPYPGVRVLHRVGSGLDVHVVVADLSDPRVSLVATRPGDAGITTSEFARRYDAQVAVNAHFFNHGPCGLAVGDGQVAERAYEHNCRASIGFGRENQVAVFDSLMIPHGPVPEPWMTEVLSGKPFILRDGHALNNWLNASHMYTPHPRTAVGVTADRGRLVLIAADGRRNGAQGLTGFQLLALFQEFGVTDALNLDGGGSTALVVGGRLRNHPADGHENAVVSHFGIRVRSDLAWYRAQELGHGASSTALREGDTAAVWLEARNTGRATWQPGTDARSPALEVHDGADRFTAVVSAATPPGAVGRFEVRWTARGVGPRSLHARLVAPDGGELTGPPVALELRVDEPADPAHPAPTLPARVTQRTTLRAPARPATPRSWGWEGALVAAAALSLRRRAGYNSRP